MGLGRGRSTGLIGERSSPGGAVVLRKSASSAVPLRSRVRSLRAVL